MDQDQHGVQMFGCRSCSLEISQLAFVSKYAVWGIALKIPQNVAQIPKRWRGWWWRCPNVQLLRNCSGNIPTVHWSSFARGFRSRLGLAESPDPPSCKYKRLSPKTTDFCEVFQNMGQFVWMVKLGQHCERPSSPPGVHSNFCDVHKIQPFALTFSVLYQQYKI